MGKISNIINIYKLIGVPFYFYNSFSYNVNDIDSRVKNYDGIIHLRKLKALSIIEFD